MRPCALSLDEYCMIYSVCVLPHARTHTRYGNVANHTAIDIALMKGRRHFYFLVSLATIRHSQITGIM